MVSEHVKRSEMTQDKQLARAKEIYSNATLDNLSNLILMANSDNTAYILYGVKHG